jgi:hypothetical protein
MNTPRLGQRAACLVLAAFVTLGLMSGLNVLAAHDAGTSLQAVATPGCLKA